MDKHLKALAPVYVGTKFVKLDAEVCILLLLAINYLLLIIMKVNVFYNLLQNAPFFVAKLAIKTLPCVILFK